MNRHLVMTAAAALAGTAVLVGAAACGRTLAGGQRPECHGRASALPRSAMSHVSFTSVSCPSAGNCTAGGFYPAGSGDIQGFVVSQVHGVWGSAEKIPGLAALNTHRDAEVDLVSCASAGNCGAGGYYTNGLTYAGTHDQQNAEQAFVASEVNGVWCTAEEIPGSAALNKGKSAGLRSMSCPSAGNCSAVGSYSGLAPNSSQTEATEGFAVSQVNGVWGRAQPVPGSSTLNSLSCASPGNCGAVGDYNTRGTARASVFVVSQTGGVWGRPATVPGFAALNQGANADIYSVSCPSPGNCGATGFYTDGAARQEVFVVSEVDGNLRDAQQIPGSGGPRYTQDDAGAVSCGSPGNCTAGGGFGGSRTEQAFVASQVDGMWQKAEKVPGSAGLSTGGGAQVASVACASAGNCSAAGTGFGTGQAFVDTEVHGVWGKARDMPGLGSQPAPLSCASAGNCLIAGSSGYLASQVNGVWGKAERIRP